jgi:hypothetical protein
MTTHPITRKNMRVTSRPVAELHMQTGACVVFEVQHTQARQYHGGDADVVSGDGNAQSPIAHPPTHTALFPFRFWLLVLFVVVLVLRFVL